MGRPRFIRFCAIARRERPRPADHVEGVISMTMRKRAWFASILA
jgi:hypothetical protein